MNFSAKATCASWLAHPQLSRLAALGREQRLIVGALLTMLVWRLLPASFAGALDRGLGRPGDGIMLLLALLGIAVLIKAARANQSSLPPGTREENLVAEPVAELLDMHLRLDEEIDRKLVEVIAGTETSAMEIMANVRDLFDTASNLVAYLNNSSIKGGALEREIFSSVTSISEVGLFIEQMPAKIERDMQNVHSIVSEIKGLSGLVEAVKQISMQSHLLAINASIEASRAGASGAAFRAVADEMRVLANNSGQVAKQINDGLSRARHVIDNGIAAGIMSSSQELEQITHAVDSIRKIKDNFEDISQYYKTSFMVVTKHNVDLAKNIGEVLGTIQYQDVVRQCVDRIRFAIERRNQFLKNSVDRLDSNSQAQELLQLPALLELIRIEYLAEEEKHNSAASHAIGIGTELKIELF